ncbi:MAG TPA: WbqC family protein [Prolixibacteraceae bacterium]|nr:WbqC family protein [Prolixibacteraceae bacterium]HPR85421.1 WbqC family protein [Prolixibacteraceae bacterium]
MTNQSSILLSTAYFAPVRYFSKLASYQEIYLEKHENFVKQTYRNRTVILGANGPISLIVPVEKGRAQKIQIKDLRIAYDEEWQRNHWRTIFSAYNSSPFFEYYADDIEPFFQKKHEFLFDFNQQITETILEALDIEANFNFTEDFEQVPDNCLNFREQISPKLHLIAPDPTFKAQSYTQVFSEKFGFVPDLSILDLLFNEGPSASEILVNCFVGK